MIGDPASGRLARIALSAVSLTGSSLSAAPRSGVQQRLRDGERRSGWCCAAPLAGAASRVGCPQRSL